MRVIEHLVLFKSKSLTLFFFLTLFCTSKIPAQIYPDSTVHKMLKEGIKLIVDQNYNEATKLFGSLEKMRSSLPLGKIYLAATLIAKSYDYQEPFDDEAISEYLDDANKITQSLLNSDDKNIWNHYFYALAQGYNAYYDALKENWFSAFSTGLNSMSAFEYCLDEDRNFYESLIAIGTYKFWRSKKTEFLDWLPFVPNEEELGIDYLKKAIKFSGYNSHLAVHSLIWIYIEQGDFDNAVKVADTALNRDPDSRLFKWGLARAYENKNPEISINLYEEILNSYPKELKTNKINIITLKHLIAQQYVKLGKNKEALDLCNEILAIYGYSKYEFEKLSKRLDRVKQLKNDLIKK
jgi:tetratricopeptide (TPR) repeat protein